ncbi:MAG: alanine racemase [Patescibacteria group bacterium]
MNTNRLEINLNNLNHNVHALKNLLAPKTLLSPVVKSNAYGHSLEIVPLLQRAGVDRFCVTSLSEALQIRKMGINCPILILGPVNLTDFELCSMYDIEVTLYSIDQLEEIQNLESRFQNTLKFHLKIDTGMTRLGILPAELDYFLNSLNNCKRVALTGVYTHFATADDISSNFIYKQFEEFKKVMQKIKTRTEIDSSRLVFHCSNSAACLTDQQYHLDMVRLGIAIYGIYPSDSIKQKCQQKGIELKPVLSFKTWLSSLKKVEAGTGIGYGQTFTTTRPSLIGVVPVGYADGVNRNLSNKGYFLIQGQTVPIVGNICMNMIMLDLTDLTKKPKIGDEVVVFGQQDNSEINVTQIANLSETIPYCVLTGLPSTLPRIVAKISSPNEMVSKKTQTLLAY